MTPEEIKDIIRQTVYEVLIETGNKPQTSSVVMTARQACAYLGIKRARLCQMVKECEEKYGENIKLGRNRFDAKKIRQLATVRNG